MDMDQTDFTSIIDIPPIDVAVPVPPQKVPSKTLESTLSSPKKPKYRPVIVVSKPPQPLPRRVVPKPTGGFKPKNKNKNTVGVYEKADVDTKVKNLVAEHDILKEKLDIIEPRNEDGSLKDGPTKRGVKPKPDLGINDLVNKIRIDNDVYKTIT